MGDLLFGLAKDYSFPEAIVLFNGLPVQGFADDGGVEFEFDGEWGKVTVGADGEPTATKYAKPPGKLKIKLKQTSVFNSVLWAAVEAQREAHPPARPSP